MKTTKKSLYNKSADDAYKSMIKRSRSSRNVKKEYSPSTKDLECPTVVSDSGNDEVRHGISVQDRYEQPENYFRERGDQEYEEDEEELLLDREDIDKQFQSTFQNLVSRADIKNICILFILTTVFSIILTYSTKSKQDTALLSDPTITNLQNEVDNLYNQLSQIDSKYQQEMNDNLNMSIETFESKIKNLIPPDFLRLKTKLDLINQKVDHLSNIVKNNHHKEHNSKVDDGSNSLLMNYDTLLENLHLYLPDNIPIIINRDETSKENASIQILPEMYEQIYNLLVSVSTSGPSTEISGDDDKKKKTVISDFDLNIDLNSYIHEYLSNQFQFLNKQSFIDEFTSKLNNDNNNNFDISERSDKILPLVNNIYNRNIHSWQNDLDFATFTQGTKLLKKLTSATYLNGNGIFPVQLLLDNKMVSGSTYWQCQMGPSNGCTWAIQFTKPVFLTKISYLHGRLSKNIHIMNSAPKKISVYVLPRTKIPSNIKEEIPYLTPHQLDSRYIKLTSFEYDISEPSIRQAMPIPSWFIKLRIPIKSVIFQIDNNYGGTPYTSIRRFIVNGIIDEDLAILKDYKFPLRFNDIPDYTVPKEHDNVMEYSRSAPKQYPETIVELPNPQLHIPNYQPPPTINSNQYIVDVPAFGDDEPAIP
ncbi:hypothetical protein TBLA_0B06600 [Henningerozyma blattae CBS 6284]|uniref:SUN domain-containing protein n=1 Tax=Henningerozyma blattae (strain ATCC 34711 / CBS 6284 / DSM 70876 / NBRC 10599 / NRRL Y-10934 / UCD 77-7) TaxID=1071380 RepID=I2GZD1_HENB6|nr:hypothetical protein TBLA_0B06600 [Tetrapisispora blattae CBS 6284]CCH59483.1 hypothetical protein TBLA_0B06600 [Tetrapisispora blattae CBS 6284]